MGMVNINAIMIIIAPIFSIGVKIEKINNMKINPAKNPLNNDIKNTKGEFGSKLAASKAKNQAKMNKSKIIANKVFLNKIFNPENAPIITNDFH